ncbi:PP65 [Orf virus]|uniref:PP65 n=1 Tax=Orf virus TaxID=10258 RepID=F1AX78_ORFV|nr:PP65 [Orf virus]
MKACTNSRSSTLTWSPRSPVSSSTSRSTHASGDSPDSGAPPGNMTSSRGRAAPRRARASACLVASSTRRAGERVSASSEDKKEYRRRHATTSPSVVVSTAQMETRRCRSMRRCTKAVALMCCSGSRKTRVLPSRRLLLSSFESSDVYVRIYRRFARPNNASFWRQGSRASPSPRPSRPRPFSRPSPRRGRRPAALRRTRTRTRVRSAPRAAQPRPGCRARRRLRCARGSTWTR